MKVTEHDEHLLGQGKKPKELIELSFPKQVCHKGMQAIEAGESNFAPRNPKR